MMTRERFAHYTVGDAKFDQDHWDLFQMMDNIMLSIRNKQYLDASLQLPLMMTALLSHFADEVEVMEKTNYPFKASHCDDHRRMKSTLDQLATQLNDPLKMHQWSGSPVQRIEELFIDHVDHYDRQFANYLNGHGKQS